jgi:hypothetical protein
VRLIDALSLLDLYARNNVQVYEDTELAENVRRAIERARSRARNTVKQHVPLEGQKELVFRSELPAGRS